MIKAWKDTVAECIKCDIKILRNISLTHHWIWVTEKQDNEHLGPKIITTVLLLLM